MMPSFWAAFTVLSVIQAVVLPLTTLMSLNQPLIVLPTTVVYRLLLPEMFETLTPELVVVPKADILLCAMRRFELPPKSRMPVPWPYGPGTLAEFVVTTLSSIRAPTLLV